MAALTGTGVLASGPPPLSSSSLSLTPYPGALVSSGGAISALNFEGGTAVDPRRYLKIGGVAVAIS